jgi:mannosylglycerate hydrolase
VVELDGFSARNIDLTPATTETGQPAGASAIESDMFRVDAADDGTLTLTDRATGQRFSGLHRLEDELDMGDLYNFCPVDGAPAWRSDIASTRVLRAGPPVWELEVRLTAERPAGLDGGLRPETELRPLTVTTIVRLIQGLPRVEFRTTLENATRDHRLRVVFPVGELPSSATVRAEGQFALVERPMIPTAPNTAWVEPPDPTHHTLGAVALGTLALLAKGLPEYEARPAHGHAELCLTLLRAVGLISRPTDAITTRPLGAGPQLLTPEGQCMGRHDLEYALLPRADAMDAVALLRASQDYRFGFTTVPAGTHIDPPLALDGDVVFSCLKGAEDSDGLILRCFNPGSSRVSARIAGGVTVSRTRLDETGTEEPQQERVIEFAPGEIVTLRIR